MVYNTFIMKRERNVKFEDLLPTSWENFVELGRKPETILQLTNLEVDTVMGLDQTEKSVLRLWQNFTKLKFGGDEGGPPNMSVEHFNQLFNAVYDPEKCNAQTLVNTGLEAASIIKNIVAILGSEKDAIGLDGEHFAKLGISVTNSDFAKFALLEFEGDMSQYTSPNEAFVGNTHASIARLRENAQQRFSDKKQDADFINKAVLFIASRIYILDFVKKLPTEMKVLGKLEELANPNTVANLL